MTKYLFIILSLFALSGCAASKHEVNAWREVEKNRIEQQGLTDRELIRARKAGGEQEVEGKITILPAPVEIPMITTTVTEAGYKGYTEDLGEIEKPERETVTTRVDTTALAIMKLGEVASRLAQNATKEQGKGKVSHGDGKGEIGRIVYERTPMPKSNTAEVVEATGKALSSQGWIGDVLKTLFMVKGAVDLASTPSQVGHNVSNSNNPITTKTTTTTQAAE